MTDASKSEHPTQLTVGVIGFGIMGQGIAHVFGVSGHKVIVMARSRESYDTRLKSFERSVSKSLSRSDVDMTAEDLISRLSYAEKYADFRGADLVIEAVSEDDVEKAAVLGKLCEALDDKTIIATNTSSFSITQLAACSDRPDKFIGIHFMNPAPVMPLVEIVRGLTTDESTLDTVTEWVEGLGKTVVTPADSPGFILNRILIPMINEAIYCLHEGGGSVESIDKTLKGAANHPMGPLELADLIGLDTCLAIMQKLHSGMSDPKYRPCPLLIRYVEAGWLGRKTKKGFYDYKAPGRPATWPLSVKSS